MTLAGAAVPILSVDGDVRASLPANGMENVLVNAALQTVTTRVSFDYMSMCVNGLVQ